MDYQDDLTDQPKTSFSQEQAALDSVIDSLGQTSYEQLDPQYKTNRFAEQLVKKQPTSGLNVIDILVQREHLLVLDFLGQSTAIPTSDKKEEILKQVATLADPAQLDQGLKTLDNQYAIPASYNPADYQAEATKIYQAVENIKAILAQVSIDDYIGDVKSLLAKDDARLADFETKLKSITTKLETIYSGSVNKKNVPPEFFQSLSDLLRLTNRSALTIKGLIEEKSMGDIVSIVLRITNALDIVKIIKTKITSQPIQTEEFIRQEIFNFAVNQIHL